MDKLNHNKKHGKKLWKKAILVFTLLVFLVFITLVYWNWRNFASASDRLFGSSNIIDVAWPSQLRNDSGRVNVLIAGYGIDKANHGGKDLTDTIMILSLDQTSKTGYILSIPRDFYVNIPGRGQAKINEAYQVGEISDFSEQGYAEGGIGMLEKVIHDTYGIETHYYALVDFTTVKEVVEALGGITVNIKSEDKRGIFDPNFEQELGGPLKLSNGIHQIDGNTALKLTRARGATSGSYGFPRSDFNRTQHQQLVLEAIKEKLNWKLLLNPAQNDDILNTMARNIKTDTELREALPLYQLLHSTPNSKIETVGLHDYKDQDYYTSYTTPFGQSALIPADGINNYASIRAAIKSLNL